MRLSLFLVLLSVFVLNAEIPNFKEDYLLEHTGGNGWLSDGKYPSFTHADWDLDGDKDMLVGYMFTKAGTAGHMVYYENTGSDDNPIFEYKKKLPVNVGGA